MPDDVSELFAFEKNLFYMPSIKDIFKDIYEIRLSTIFYCLKEIYLSIIDPL